MKTNYLILFLLLLLTSCQDKYSEDTLMELWRTRKTLRKSNKLLTWSNEGKIAKMEADCKVKVQFQPLVETTKEIVDLTRSLYDRLGDLQAELLYASGDQQQDSIELANQTMNVLHLPSSLNNKTVVKEILIRRSKVRSTSPNIAERLDLLKNTCLKHIADLWLDESLKQTIFAHNSEKEATMQMIREQLPLMDLDNETLLLSNAEAWMRHHFEKKPKAVAILKLEQIKSTLMRTETYFINFLAEQIGNIKWTNDILDVVAYTPLKKIRQGDTYKAQLQLISYSSEPPMLIEINGDTLDIENGKANYKTVPRKRGEQTFSARITMTNPLTGYSEKYVKEYHYSVN